MERIPLVQSPGIARVESCPPTKAEEEIPWRARVLRGRREVHGDGEGKRLRKEEPCGGRPQ